MTVNWLVSWGSKHLHEICTSVDVTEVPISSGLHCAETRKTYLHEQCMLTYLEVRYFKNNYCVRSQTQSSCNKRIFHSDFYKKNQPLQRHITGVLENTRVFFSTPVSWCQITGVLTNTRVFSIKYPGIWQPVKYPGKWQRKQRAVCTGIYTVC